ncbi:hypothetical protein E2542_SST02215 [Spatholobus suberectus]|nr:hypothetical protein E2542_SST02215 [Spatholobus suberectus]
MLNSPRVDELLDLAAKPKTLFTQTLNVRRGLLVVMVKVMISKCKKGLVDDDDDVYDKGRGGSFEGVMMMVVMKGQREWEGGRGRHDCYCEVSLKG